MKHHACVFFCYNNIDHIIQSFNSIYRKETDYFILENKSANSNLIEDYFTSISKKIFSYIQFNENISNNALPIFIKDFNKILKEYSYVTITDGDLYVQDIQLTFQEIFKNLSYPEVLMSCVDLSMSNLPNVPGASSWIPQGVQIRDYISCLTGAHLMTLKTENFSILEKDKLLDSILHQAVLSLNKVWAKTLINKAYHLTWDLYTDNNPYFLAKINTPNIWDHNRVCDYRTII